MTKLTITFTNEQAAPTDCELCELSACFIVMINSTSSIIQNKKYMTKYIHLNVFQETQGSGVNCFLFGVYREFSSFIKAMQQVEV